MLLEKEGCIGFVEERFHFIWVSLVSNGKEDEDRDAEIDIGELSLLFFLFFLFFFGYYLSGRNRVRRCLLPTRFDYQLVLHGDLL